jgi:hypothetical protein
MLSCAARLGLRGLRRAAGAAAGLHAGAVSAAAAAAEAAPALASAAAQETDFEGFGLTEDQVQFKNVAQAFAREDLAPFR